jgi:translation initiation factor IF-3
MERMQKHPLHFDFPGRCIHIAKATSGQMINDEIRFQKVRLIESDGSMVGVVPISDARKRAEDQSLDLVLISAQADNPVCKIMDYNKFKFEQSKKEKEAKKNQRITEIKEVGLKLTTEEHDLSYKTKNACRFLEEGDRVKVVLKFRGREMTYTSRGFEVMRQFAKACEAVGQVDREPKVEGRNMVMFLAPLKK